MRGLTPAEAAALQQLGGSHGSGHRPIAPEERETFKQLVEQGRAATFNCSCCARPKSVLSITMEGREALAIWLAVRERMEKEQS